MEGFMNWLKAVNGVVWGPGMLVLLVGTGLYIHHIGLEIFHIPQLFRGLKNLWAGRNNQSEQGENFSVQRADDRAGPDIGTGNINERVHRHLHRRPRRAILDVGDRSRGHGHQIQRSAAFRAFR